MKMKKFWKRVIARVLTTVMLVSIFSTVDMGWNVREVKAEDQYEEFTEDDWSSGSYKSGDPLKKTYTQVTGTITKEGVNNSGFIFGMNRSITVSTTPEFASLGYEIKKVEISEKNGSLSMGCSDYANLNKWSTTSGKISGNTGGMGYFKTITVSDVYAPSVTIIFSDGKLASSIGYSNMKVYYGLHVCSSSTVKTNVAAQNATCTTDGWNAYSVCYCGKVYAQGNFSTSYASVNAWKTSVAGKRPQLGHSFGYTGSGSIITAKCNRDQTHTAKLTLTANGGTYDGTSKPATVSNWSSSTLSGLAQKPTTITYTNQTGTATYNSSIAPTNVGNYTASITVGSAKATMNFSITKKNVTVGDLAVTCNDSVYNGQAKSAQVSVASGKDGLGDITVKYQKQNGTGWDEATTDKPVNAGTYKVLVSTTEGNNFNATSSDLTNDTWKFTISKKPITINPNAGQEKYFGENDPTPFNYTYAPELIGSDTIVGELGRETGEDVISEGYAYTVVTLSAGDNYELTIPADAPKFVINKLNSIDPPTPGEGYILDYDEEKLSAEPDTEYEIGKKDENGNFVKISSPEKLEPGDTEQTYYVRYKENENHPESDWTPITIAPRPAAPAESTVVERMDVSFTLQMISGVEYSIDSGTTWFIATDAGNNVTVSDGKITFGGLNPDTEYTVHSRVKATNSAPHGHETEQTVKTKKALPSDLTTMFVFTPPTGEDLTYNKQPKGAEVSKKDPYQGIGDPIIKYYKIVDGEEVEVEKPTDAGEYIVKVSAPATPDYPAVPETEIGTFTIAKKEITITPTSAQSKAYGTPDPVLTYDATPALCTGDTFAGALTYDSAGVYTNVGNYSIVMGNLSAGDNYTLTLESETFEIKRAEYTSGPAKNIGYTIDYVDETMVVISAADFELSSTDTETATPLVEDKVEPGKTYYIRYKESTNQSESPWSAITLPNRPAAPNATGKQETVMNKKDAEITGVNSTMEYKFDGDGDWTGVTGSIISNPDNKNIAIRVKASNDNKNFYGQEKSITFTASTTKLKVRIGDKVLEVPYGATIPVTEKPQDPTPPAGQIFMYWAFGDEKWDFDGEDGVTDPNKVTGNITLVPVWGVEIHGTITAQDYDSITEVSLVDGKGNSYNHHDLDKQEDGTYKYSVIAPVGVDYNLVVEGKKIISETPHNITKTQLVNLKQGGNGDIVMPAGVFSSKVTKENAGEYEHTLVGGLDEIADAHEGTSDIVTVEMKVSADVSNDSKIKSAIKNKTLDFVELTLTKTTNNDNVDIGSTNAQLLEIIIPYNTVGKYNISVYRYHGDKVETLISAKNIDGEYIKVGADTVTIYAKKFSTYAIGYSTTPPSSGSSDHNKSQEDDSNDSGSTPSGPSLPKKDTPAEKKPSDGLPKLIAKNTPKKDGDKEITDKNLLAFNSSGDEKDNPEKNEDVKDDPVVENDATQLEVGTSVPETEANKGSHRHHLLWLYLVLLALFFVARAITKEKTNAVKISLFAGDVVIAGLLLFVVKICVLSVIVCLAEIVAATVIHLQMKNNSDNSDVN